MANPTHSPAPWVYDTGACAIRYQLPVGHPERYDSDDDGWRNVVSLYSACGGVDGNTDVELMTAAPAMLAALRLFIDVCPDAIIALHRDGANGTASDLEEALAAARTAIAAATTAVRHG